MSKKELKQEELENVSGGDASCRTCEKCGHTYDFICRNSDLVKVTGSGCNMEVETTCPKCGHKQME